MSRPRALLSCFSLLAPLAGQQPPAAEPTPDPVHLVERAEKLLGSSAVEEGILLCWQAIEAVEALPPHPVRGAAGLTALALLRKHDPSQAEREKVAAQVAKLQVELAQAYRSKKWFDVAETRLAVADRYDRSVGNKERALLQAQRPKGKAGDAAPVAAPPPDADPLLRRENTVRVAGTWSPGEQGLECAAHPGKAEDPLSEWIAGATHADHEISVLFRPAQPNGGHNAGLWFGGGDTEAGTGYVGRCSYVAAERSYFLEIYALRNWEYKRLAENTVPAAAVADGGYRRLAVRVSGARIRLLLDSGEALEANASEPVRGKVGLVVGVRDDPSCAVSFRGLCIGPLPADAPSDEQLEAEAQKKAQGALVAAVDRAKELLAQKQPEPASLVLREARQQIGRLAPGMLRDNLAATIDTMIAQADPLAVRRKKAAADCAAALLALADRYAAAGMPRLAQRVVGDAATFDPDGLTARVAQAQKAVDDWIVAEARAHAAELAPPADDGAVLREWFAAGRRLDPRLRDWVVDGAAARVDDMQPRELTAYLPKEGVPPLAKASVHVRLPAAGTSAGWCFDVAGLNEFAIALLTRRAKGLELTAFRLADGKWHNLGSKAVQVEPWRLDGWFALGLEATATGITVRCRGTELALARTKLGKATGRIGLYADNDSKGPAKLEFRAFQVGP